MSNPLDRNIGSVVCGCGKRKLEFWRWCGSCNNGMSGRMDFSEFDVEDHVIERDIKSGSHFEPNFIEYLTEDNNTWTSDYSKAARFVKEKAVAIVQQRTSNVELQSYNDFMFASVVKAM